MCVRVDARPQRCVYMPMCVHSFPHVKRATRTRGQTAGKLNMILCDVTPNPLR